MTDVRIPWSDFRDAIKPSILKANQDLLNDELMREELAAGRTSFIINKRDVRADYLKKES